MLMPSIFGDSLFEDFMDFPFRRHASSSVMKTDYYGSCSRSFYVGENVEESNIKARFENGILKLSVPKSEDMKAIENNKYIAIEG